MKISDTELYNALVEHVARRGTARQLAEATGLSTDQAGSILRGRSRRKVPRPPGFEHPWPETETRRVSPEKLAEAFERYHAERLSIRAFSRLIGVTQNAGWLIFHGYLYKDVERPPAIVHHAPVGGRKKLGRTY
jgi:hypothetical protein